MAGEREIGEETRNQMMQNLFGDQSEEEEEDEIEEPSTPHRPYYHSDEEGEGEVEVDIEGQEEVEDGSEGEQHDLGDRRHSQDHDQGEESEAERNQTSPERENITSDHRLESEVKDAVETGEEEEEEEEDEDDQGGYGQRVVTSRRREVLSSESEERSKDSNRYINDNEDEEVDQDRKPGSPSDGEDHAIVRDVFGDSEDDEPAEYEVQNEHQQDSHGSDVGEEDEFYKKNFRPEDIVPDEDGHYDSEDENIEQKTKEKAVGPPLDLDVPMCRPPSQSNKMNMIRVSNIMGVEPKPFDPKTYVEEDVFVTDESGGKKRIRLEDNIVRWRKVRNRDGTFSLESNARFVRWSDGSLQLLIGNEVLDISVQEAQHDHTHLFLRHEKGVLQSQGRLLRKMRFMPSSLSSKSHRLLTALVDSRHKKVYKVKNCITDIDPEREKEEKERAEGQTIRANTLLQRKREKVSKKYTPSVDRSRQLSPGFLEEALDEDDEHEDYYSTHRSTARRRFDEDMEIESQAERRIINSKKSNASQRALPRRGSLSSQHPSRPHLEEYSDNDKEESEYESDGDFRESPARGTPESDHEDEYDEEEEAEDEIKGTNKSSDDEEEKIRPKGKDVEGSSRKRKEIESDVESPPRKPASHRRMAIVFDSDED